MPLFFLWQPVTAPIAMMVVASTMALCSLICVALIVFLSPLLNGSSVINQG
jgi:hypothetical protein